MCRERTLKREKSVGVLLDLCKRYPLHLAEAYSLHDEEEPGPAQAVFAAYHATSAVIEFEYFDLDYRSEFSATHETSFLAGEPSVDRIHFFSGTGAKRSTALHEFLQAAAADYKGYAIVRSQSVATIGRTMIAPDGPYPALIDENGLASHVRTAVEEHVQVFGISLSVKGVPFMEQDGQLLRCAHVTAWMAHFTMVLRGVTPRRPSASFHLAEDPSNAYGRSYPSSGLTIVGQSQMLSRLDLPPEVIDGAALVDARPLYWYDRTELGRVAASTGSKDEQRIWLAENLTSTICRYLNSGIAPILNRDEHSQMVCGYLREEDLADVSSGKRIQGQTDVTALLVQDDQLGPYHIVTVEKILDEVLGAQNIPVAVTVPLPRGLWLSGSSAERAGATVIEEVVQKRYAAIDARRLRERRHPGRFVRMRQQLKDLNDAVAVGGPSGRYAIRSFALTGSDFKADFTRRLNDVDAARVVGYAQFPKFVWVVEVLDRALRAQGKKAVVGTVALDGSAVSLDGVKRPPTPLIIHIPGQISRLPGDQHAFSESSWESTHAEPYYSGRWNHTHSTYMSPESVAARYKAASVPVSF